MLSEVMISMGVFGVAVVSLYGGISQAFSTVRTTREEQRATQILVEKMEALRLVTWDQLNTEGFIPTTFRESHQGLQAAITPVDQLVSGLDKTTGSANGTAGTLAEGEGQGIVYVGQVTIDLAKLPKAYIQYMRHVTISVTWRSGRHVRSRSMETYISQYGIQNYSF